MRFESLLVFALAFVALPTDVQAQRMQEREEEFLKSQPLVDDPLPDVTVYSPDGLPFKTADLRGHYSVLTFGCLT
jgi:cytochrome oxidase Cu insertion factor (SCO1/SenC/PrrC family)